MGECAEMLQTFGPCAFEDVGTLQDGSPSSEIQKEALSPADLTKTVFSYKFKNPIAHIQSRVCMYKRERERDFFFFSFALSPQSLLSLAE